MPIVTIKLLEGRSVEKKRALVKEVTKAICETVDCPETAVSIVIEDMQRHDYATSGVLICDK